MKKPSQKKGVARNVLDRNRQTVSPLPFPRTFRGIEIDVATTMPPGRVVPIFADMLFREDAIRRGRIQCTIRMEETEEVLMNAVHAKMEVWFVPFLAFERFDGSMDAFNDSYAKQNAINFFEMEPRGTIESNQILKYLGEHAGETDQVNTNFVEAYNIIDEFKRINRSDKLPVRGRLDKTLAGAFWKHGQFNHIVAEPDQAIIQGEVALRAQQTAQQLAPEQDLNVKGIAKYDSTFTTSPWGAPAQGNKGDPVEAGNYAYGRDGAVGGLIAFQEDPANPGDLNMRVTMPEIALAGSTQQIELFLADIEAAKKSVWYARLREQYAGIPEDYIVDLLMQGINVPEQAYKQPMRLAHQDTVFGIAKRNATDGPNLTNFVAEGSTFLDVMVNLPRMTTGGIVMVLAEVVPDEIWERKQNPALFVSDPDELPNALEDDLDQDKIDIVYNKYVDVNHNDPTAIFGYEPQNAKWDKKGSKVGGRYFRQTVDLPADQNRMKIWSNQTENPTLTTDFMIVNEIRQDVFKDAVNDPFEVHATGQLIVEGNTQFGPALIEQVNSYEKIVAQIPEPVTIPETP